MIAETFADPSVPSLIVTGHPNHELAILGFVQRARPRLLFLTDGGGPERVAETRRAHAARGLADHAHFLDRTEESLYRALLDRDLAVFAGLVADVRAEIDAWSPRQILCESIELYNPLHDITLPLVRAAARGLPGIEVVEFPLIAQVPTDGERYRVQRLPESRAAISLQLTESEVAAKLQARDEIYRCLRRQLGPVLAGLDRENAAIEHFALAETELPQPGVDHVLRYEWRGRLLQERGEIDRVITFEEHFLPVVAGL